MSPLEKDLRSLGTANVVLGLCLVAISILSTVLFCLSLERMLP